MKFEERNLEYREFVEAYLREVYQKYTDQPQKPLFEAVEYSGYTLIKGQDYYNIHVVCAMAESAGR